MSSEGKADAELVAGLATDPAALEAFYRTHVAAVAGFVSRRVSDPSAVADIVSDTFLAAIGGSSSFDPRRSPDTARWWLLAIARHEVVRHQARDARQQALGRRDGARLELTADDTARIDELIDAQRLAPDIRTAVERLSPPVREVFELVAVDGIPAHEVAAMLGISPVAVRTRLTRARRRLRLHLDALDEHRSRRAAAHPVAQTEPPAASPPVAPSDDTHLLPSTPPGGNHGL